MMLSKDFSKVCPVCGGPIMYIMVYTTGGSEMKEVCMNKETTGCASVN